MLQIENEYEKLLHSKYYENNVSISNLETNKSHNKTDHTPQVFEESSNMNNIYENPKNKIQTPKERFWTILLLLESPKRKEFSITRPRICFSY